MSQRISDMCDATYVAIQFNTRRVAWLCAMSSMPSSQFCRLFWCPFVLFVERGETKANGMGRAEEERCWSGKWKERSILSFDDDDDKCESKAVWSSSLK